jgi:hypothetical protein
MKELGKRIWNEPAAAIGLLTTLILLVINIVGDSTWDAQSIIAIVAPLLSALGIRPLVKPTAKIDEENAAAARSKLQTVPATDAERTKGF